MQQEPIKLTKQGIIDTACRPGKSEDDLAIEEQRGSRRVTNREKPARDDAAADHPGKSVAQRGPPPAR
jgi:hypothetical protein